jgi:hypothetical protein
MAVDKTPAYLARLEKRKEVRLQAKLARKTLKEQKELVNRVLCTSDAPRGK